MEHGSFLGASAKWNPIKYYIALFTQLYVLERKEEKIIEGKNTPVESIHRALPMKCTTSFEIGDELHCHHPYRIPLLFSLLLSPGSPSPERVKW